MPLMVQAADPVISITQQEQLQKDRDTQRERNLRLDAERVGTVVSEPALIDVPSNKNGTSFYIKQIQLDGVPKELSFLNKIARKHEQKHVTVSDITNIRNAFQRKLLDKGYVTSQVYIPEQNLMLEPYNLWLCLVEWKIFNIVILRLMVLGALHFLCVQEISLISEM